MSKPVTNEETYFRELHRKAVILEALIAVVFERVACERDPSHRDGPRDWVADNVIDAARDLSEELSSMALEDPKLWAGKGGAK